MALILVVVSPCAFGAGNGLKGEYFDNTGVLGSPVLTRTDATVDFNWGSSGPGHGITNDYFSARWTGQVEAPAAGAFKFVTYSNNGIRVWVNNALVIDNWTAHPLQRNVSSLVTLTASQHADIRMEYFENGGIAEARLLWIAPGQTDEAVIPQSRLFSTAVTTESPVPVFLSSLTPTFATNGWGAYQRDSSNGETGSADGAVLSLGGVKFGKGLGVHARSELRYALAGKYSQFLAEIGVDDEVSNHGSVTFEVWLDGVKALTSPVLHGTDKAMSINIQVGGKTELKLIVLDGGDGLSYDHADWAGARVLPVAGGGVVVPPPPTGLTATPGDKQVTLSWSASAGAATYSLFRGTTSNGEGSTPIKTGITGTSFVNGDLTNGTTYFFKITAVNSTGTSGMSNEASAKPAAAVALPPPTGLAAAAGDKQVLLTWNAVAGAASYNVYRGTSANGEASTPVMTGITALTFTNTGLTNGTTYFFKVAAVNSTTTSGMSNEASAKPVAPVLLPAPTGLAAVAGDKQVVLTWNAVAGALSYNVYRGTSANGEASTPVMTGVMALTFTNTGLTDGTTYFFKVAAVNANGAGDKSNEAIAEPVAPVLLPAPTGLAAVAGDKQVVLTWTAVAGALSYDVYRGTSANGEASTPVMTGVTALTFTNTGLTDGTTYFFKVAAVNANGAGDKSNEASAKTVAPPPPPAPTGLAAVAGDKQAVLTWTASTGATSYNVYRGTSANGEASSPVMTGVTALTFTNTGLTNGTTYFFKVAAVNANGTSDKSNEANAKPVAPPPPPAPTGLAAAAGNTQVVLTWTAVTGATSYNVYRGTTANGESSTAIMTGVTALTFTNTALTNGTTYFYKVAAVNANGTSDKSNEASAMPTAPGLLLTQAQKDAFRFLRQSTFGPNQALVDHVVQVGKSPFLDEQFALPPTAYPDALVTMPNMELVSEQFFANAISGQDQLRQRVAWALSQIFVTSAVKVDNTHAMVPYIRMLETRAFDNVKDIIHDVTLSPAMGEFLDMINNKKADSSGIMPNENYAREWLQLFSIGLVELNDDGTPMAGNPATYTQSTISDMARALSGWTYGDNVAGNPTRTNPAFYDGPMEPVDKFHDIGAKTILGVGFPAGQTAQQDFDQALSVVFNHHNVGPFLVRQLIQKLVSSNPSPTYIHDVVQVFNNNGQGVRGDLRAVVKAILLHPEASSPASVKFSEPALFLTTVCRVLCSSVVDHPFMSDFSQNMSQQIWFAPSVFNYFSPNYRVGNLFAPEMQIWTTATAMTRTNWIASLISGGFGGDVVLNLAPFTSVAADPNALLDTVNSLLAGGTMPSDVRAAILQALTVSRNNSERVQTAIYLTAASMQYQVEH
jgi:uncharacterized protein (DUF1800 family)